MAAGVKVWLVPHDFSKLELRNAVIQVLGSAPSSPTTGQTYYDSGATQLKIWDGSAWQRASFATDPFARANHTGSQLAATISDLATTVQAYRLDQFAAPTSSVTFNSQRITSVGTATSGTDAINRAWTDAFDYKPSVRVATIATGTLATAFANTSVVDGVTLATGDRILLKDQTTASENGIYVVASSGAPTRAVDFAAGMVTSGARTYVEEGTTNAKRSYVLANTGTVTVGSTGLTFRQNAPPPGGAANAVLSKATTTDGDYTWSLLGSSNFTTDPYARANHTGSQLAATISDLATTVQAYRLDQFAVPTASVNLNSQKITNLATPTASTDAANKSYVDGLVNGLDWKASVRAASTAAGGLTTAYENGDVIDGVTLVTGDRILLKNQAALAENGIYTVNVTGAPTRATDADTSGEVTPGMAMFVEEGTANGNTQWALTTDAPITLGTTGLAFAQIGATASSPIAGAGLTLTGTTLDVVGGTGITVAPDLVSIDTSVVMRRFAQDFGNGSATSFTITHSLGTKDVLVQAYDNTTPFGEVGVDVEHTSTTTVTIRVTTAPTTNQYRVVCIG